MYIIKSIEHLRRILNDIKDPVIPKEPGSSYKFMSCAMFVGIDFDDDGIMELNRCQLYKGCIFHGCTIRGKSLNKFKFYFEGYIHFIKCSIQLEEVVISNYNNTFRESKCNILFLDSEVTGVVKISKVQKSVSIIRSNINSLQINLIMRKKSEINVLSSSVDRLILGHADKVHGFLNWDTLNVHDSDVGYLYLFNVTSELKQIIEKKHYTYKSLFDDRVKTIGCIGAITNIDLSGVNIKKFYPIGNTLLLSDCNVTDMDIRECNVDFYNSIQMINCIGDDRVLYETENNKFERSYSLTRSLFEDGGVDVTNFQVNKR